MKKVTQEELEKGTGTEGNASLVAVDGKVYDVTSSKMWKNGIHFKTHQAGKDLSLGLQAAPHGDDVLERFEQIGELEDEGASAAAAAPHVLIDKILDEHPHPISVHFPIALSIVGSLFMALFLLFRNPNFELFTLYCIILATLASPVSIATGVISWYYNYNAVWTHIYRIKTYLSVVLVFLQITALMVRLGITDGVSLSSPWYWLYILLALGMAPTVMALGYFGGKITFPR